jgi:hypothetical protein
MLLRRELNRRGRKETRTNTEATEEREEREGTRKKREG